MTAEEAQAALDRRAAVAVLAGAALGQLPLLWLIREALDELRRRRFESPSLRMAIAVRLLRSGGHEFWLHPDNGLRILAERDSFGSEVRSHEVPNAALVLHDAVKEDPVRAELLLLAIESATEGRPK